MFSVRTVSFERLSAFGFGQITRSTMKGQAFSEKKHLLYAIFDSKNPGLQFISANYL